MRTSPKNLQFWTSSGLKIVGYQDVVPVGGGVAVANQHFYFIGRQLAIADAAAVLYIPQVIFVFAFGDSGYR